MPEISDEKLLGVCEAHRKQAIGYYTDQISVEQQEALRRYLGLPYGDEQEGRSQVTSEDAAQVVDWTIPDLLEPFVAGDQVVEFLPQEERDRDTAKQATDYVNHIFWKDNPGFQILYDAAKDGLIQKMGVTKVCWVKNERTETHTVSGINLARLQELKDDSTVTITEQSSERIKGRDLRSEEISDEQLLEMAQKYPDGKEYTVTFDREIDRSFVEIIPVPPEEFRITPRQSTMIRSPYIAHHAKRKRSELYEMGFPEEIVDDLPPYAEGADWVRREQIRFWNERRAVGLSTSTMDSSQDEIMLLEEYVLVDVDEDGDTETVQVFRVNDQILSREVVDEHPFEAFCPFPMPHKVIGQSLVEKMLQTQRIKTVLTRGLLDNVYLNTNPQREVPEGAITDDGSTIDDLLTFRVGGLVRTKEPGQLREMRITDTTGTSLQAIGYFDMVRDMETGAVRGSAGLSSEAIDTTQPITAEEARRTARSQLKRTRMMARNFAEDYLAPLMGKVYRLVVKYQDFERIIRLRDEFVSMDPRSWNANMDVECKVGLGFPNREEKAAVAERLLERQVQAMEIGLSGTDRIYNTLEIGVEAAGMGDAEQFFIDPTSEEGQARAQQLAAQAQQPDARLAEVQQRGQIEAAKLQQDGQLKAARLQQDAAFRQIQIQQDAEIKMAEAQMSQQTDVLIAQMKAQGDAAGQAQDFEASMAKIQADFEAKLAQIRTTTAARQRELDDQFDLAIRQQDQEAVLAVRQQNMEAALSVTQTEVGAATNGAVQPVRPGGAIG